MRLVLSVLAVVALAGCTASSAGTGNFELVPERVGWFAGDEAQFTLTLEPSLTRKSPSFSIDRHFAVEEIQLAERGVKVGGDFETKDPDEVSLRFSRANETGDEFVLNAENPTLDIHITLPTQLRDSEYALELKLFKVGWVKSDAFRVDLR